MSEYVAKLDLWVTQQRMPIRVKGFCKHVNNDDVAVINEDLSDNAKLETVEHEARHFLRGDLESDECVLKLESEGKS